MKKFILTILALTFFAPVSAFAADQEKAKEMLATLLNLQGFLCAKVTNVHPLELPKHYEVRCIEYRGGSGTVDYIVNLETGRAVKR